MKAERDELALLIFPALRKVCEERGIAWSEVDLRWGIPPEKEKEEVLDTCLKFIDECRPYFIGMLGERYGWVEEAMPDVVIGDYPWIQAHSGKSITELEILHGVLNNPEMAGHAYFYFRDPAYIETLPEDQRPDYLEGPNEEEITQYGIDEAKRRAEQRRGMLDALKEKIRKSCVSVLENYPDPIRFGELVKEDMMQVIDSLGPPPKPQTDEERAEATLDREEMAHEAFAASRFGVYVPRQEYFDRLDSHTSGEGPPLAILGESGGGKSALLAHWAYRYRDHHPDDLVLVHFVGSSSESTDWAYMLRRFMGEFKRKFNITEEVPEKEEALMAAFANWLYMAATRGRVIIVIDALNQLEDRNGAPDLVWLPPKIPENIRLIVSTLPGKPHDAIQERGWPILEVEPLTVPEREALITCYLKKYHKELSQPVKMELASAHQCQNPLYLRALLEEIRLHGTFEHLPDQIRDYLKAETLDGLYGKILARYEQDYERDRPGLVKDTVSLLWAARRGLSKPELMDLLGIGGMPLPDAYWAPLYLAMEHSLVEKNGLINFFHDYMRKAVEARYISSDELRRESHLNLAIYFERDIKNPRGIEEYPWQLSEAREWDRLVAFLTDPSSFLAAWESNEYDIKRYWVQIEAGSETRIVEAYRNITKDPSLIVDLVLWPILSLLGVTGHLDEASGIANNIITYLREHGEEGDLIIALSFQADILEHLGDLDGAMAACNEQEQLCYANIDETKYLDFQSLLGLEKYLFRADSHTIKSRILMKQGNFDGAMKHLKEWELISKSRGNVEDENRSRISQAQILIGSGDFHNAMILIKESERISREIGDMEGLNDALSTRAMLYVARKRNLRKAMELLFKQEQIYRDRGDEDLLIDNLNNQGIIFRIRGDLDLAMEVHKEQEVLCNKVGDIEGLAHALLNQAIILCKKKCYQEAITAAKEAQRLSEAHGCTALAEQISLILARIRKPRSFWYDVFDAYFN